MVTYETLYHILFSCADDAVTLLEKGQSEEACALLKQGLLRAEDLYTQEPSGPADH